MYSIDAIPPEGCGLPPPVRLSATIGASAPGNYYASAKGTYRGVPLPTVMVPFLVLAQPRKAIEYYSSSRDHYFITTDPSEISKLDGGQTQGWTRTGHTFGVLPPLSDLTGPSNLVGVCRLYGDPEAHLDTHFYSASRSECQSLVNAVPSSWTMESRNAFSVFLPEPATGSCPERTVPLYRLFNKRSDANHRYTAALDVRAKMVADGWVPEGYGPNAVAMCSPVQ